LSRAANKKSRWKKMVIVDEDVGQFDVHIDRKRPRRSKWLIHVITEYKFKLGVEIGVQTGVTTQLLLRHCPELSMIGIDPWCEQKNNKGPNQFFDRRWNHRRARAKAQNRVRSFGSRCKLIEGFSHEVVSHFKDGMFCFVFVDGDHSYKSCKRDIELWRPKVRPGGLLCGHDINWLSVRTAVEEMLPGFEYNDKTEDYMWWYWV
jgi:predicted O-methyltransferase YrrM